MMVGLGNNKGKIQRMNLRKAKKEIKEEMISL
jgi:hypothetical protein